MAYAGCGPNAMVHYSKQEKIHFYCLRRQRHSDLSADLNERSWGLLR